MSSATDLAIQKVLTIEENVPSVHVLDWNIENISDKYNKNYFNKISLISVRYRLRNEDTTPPKEKRFFVKERDDTEFYDTLLTLGLYHNEILMYTNVLPLMHTLAADNFTPKLHHVGDKTSLWLENISENGYKCVDWELQLDVEHCIYAIKCMAKFHAMSVKLENTGGLPEPVKIHYIFRHKVGETTFSTDFISQQMPLFIGCLPQHLVDRYPKMIEELKNLSAEAVSDSLNPPSKFNVLNHCDFRIQNTAFKYDKYDVVENLKLSNFHFTGWGNLAHDLIYFVITSMKFEDYVEHFPLLVKIYMNTLNKTLSKLDCPTYNMQMLYNDMDAIRPLGFFAMCCVLPYIINDPNDPIPMENMIKNGKLQIANNVKKVYEQKIYRDSAAKWFEYFANNGSLRIPKEN